VALRDLRKLGIRVLAPDSWAMIKAFEHYWLFSSALWLFASISMLLLAVSRWTAMSLLAVYQRRFLLHEDITIIEVEKECGLVKRWLKQ